MMCVLVLAPGKWMLPLGVIFFGIAGPWALLYPQGVLGWAKKPHPRIDDPSLWRVVRLMGGLFVVVAVLVAAYILR